jgi:Transglycosylase-like domain
MDEKELQGVSEALNELRETGKISAETLAKMNGASKAYTDQLNKSMKALGSSILGVAKAMKDGEQGASVYNDSINSAADAIDSFAAKFGILGKIIGTLITAGARYAVEVNKQSDALFKTYKEISSSGLADAGGMTTIFENMQKFGYGIEQLGDMTALLKANSKELAAFGGTAASGTKAFADAAGQIQRSDIGRSLQMLGKTPDDLNKGIAGFIKQQQMIGVSSASIQQNLAQKSADYVKNLDLMSKLTGESADQLQAKLEQAQAEDAFAATQYELKKKADAGDRDAAIKYAANQELAQRLTGQALKEFQQGVGNDLSAMSKTLMTAPEAVSVLSKSAYTADEYLTALGKGAERTMKQTSGLARFNANSDFVLPFNEMGKAASRYADDTSEQQKERAKAEQELQQKGLDPATKAQVEMRIEQMKTRDEFQSLINKGINPVTKGMSKLAGGIEAVTDKLPGSETSTGTKMGGGESGGSWWKNIFGGGGGGAGGADQILATIRNRESGGNYQAQAKGSSASGAYQFTDSTWQAQAKKAGIGTEFKSAKLAPKEIQDAVAKAYVEDILKQAGGDVSKVPLAWYTGNIQGKISPQALAANNGLTPEMYQQKWMADYNKNGNAANISGPNSSYTSQLATVKPAATLPDNKTAQAQANSPADASDNAIMDLNSKLEKLNRHMEEVASNTKKSAQYAAA